MILRPDMRQYRLLEFKTISVRAHTLERGSQITLIFRRILQY